MHARARACACGCAGGRAGGWAYRSELQSLPWTLTPVDLMRRKSPRYAKCANLQTHMEPACTEYLVKIHTCHAVWHRQLRCVRLITRGRQTCQRSYDRYGGGRSQLQSTPSELEPSLAARAKSVVSQLRPARHPHARLQLRTVTRLFSLLFLVVQTRVHKHACSLIPTRMQGDGCIPMHAACRCMHKHKHIRACAHPRTHTRTRKCTCLCAHMCTRVHSQRHASKKMHRADARRCRDTQFRAL